MAKPQEVDPITGKLVEGVSDPKCPRCGRQFCDSCSPEYE